MKKAIIVGNWKMYIEKPEVTKRFALVFKKHTHTLARAEVLIAAPYILIPMLALLFAKSSTVRLAAQSVSGITEQAHTGEVSAAMLKAAGVTTVIVGHSERRHTLVGAKETDEMIHAQIQAVQKARMTALLCVGEIERDSLGSHFSVIEKQLSLALKNTSGGACVIAYEPVWAIGKSAAEAMKPADVQEMVIFIRKTLVAILGRTPALKVPILYGGSVDETNAKELLHEGGVNGFLVGRASTQPEQFLKLIKVCQ